MKTLEDTRAEIDRLDSQLVALLVERMKCLDAVVAAKKASGKAVGDSTREAAILERIGNLAGSEYALELRQLYSGLFKITRARQCKMLGLPLEEQAQGGWGHFLKLQVWGSSHGTEIGMRMENLPEGFSVDLEQLQAFLDRRAPGRDALSTARREADRPVFRRGLENGRCNGRVLEAVIKNSDARSGDYEAMQQVPRPGHADFTQWVQSGRIPAGGGEHSGRLTAPLCVAGGICLQWLSRRGIEVASRLVAAGGNAEEPRAAIEAARCEGDSVGGVIEVTVTGLKPGLGGPLFAGLESRLASALFVIPGIKGVEIGDGFKLAGMKGSQANDGFQWDGGRVVTKTNHHGGLLGGITSGMPLVLRLAMKPTPSIYKEQRSVDLAARTDTTLTLGGRHDPCIALRAMPVAEGMVAFALADAILEDEKRRPRICMTLCGNTLEKNLESLRRHWPYVEMCELRADFLDKSEYDHVAHFPESAGMPVILTLRRERDGGRWPAGEDRERWFAQWLSGGKRPFAFVDFESDFRVPGLEQLAQERGVEIIRSYHDFTGPVEHLAEFARKLRGNTSEIPKIAFAVHHCSEVEEMFRESDAMKGFPHIICAMGELGQVSRILAQRTGSMLSFASESAELKRLGLLTPEQLVRDYGFRRIDEYTELYAVTGWPLGHTRSPELNNEAFFAEAQNAVMVALPAETAQEALACARTLGVKGMAVTVPHKRAMLELMQEVSPEAKAVGAVNTVLWTGQGWYGANTDVVGFQKTLQGFLQRERLEGMSVAIIGAGGAANAVAYVIAKLGGKACVFNRTLEKGRALADKYGFEFCPLKAEAVSKLAEYSDLMVQCTSVGLSSGADSQQDPIGFYCFKGTEKLFDLIYSPAETPVMARARLAGCQVMNGAEMLAEQAREQRRLYREFVCR